MHQDIQKICAALDQLADLTVSTFPPGTDQLFSEVWGWPAPTMNRHDLAWVVRSVADDLRAANPDSYPDALKPWVSHIPIRVSVLQSQTLPTMYGGNYQGIPAFLESIKHIRDRLLPAVGWVPVPRTGSLPARLVSRTDAARRRLEELESNIPDLAGKVTAINAAHLVAENLETDLHALKEAREAVEQTAIETQQNLKKTEDLAERSTAALEGIETRAESAWNQVQALNATSLDDIQNKAKAALEKMQGHEVTAGKLIESCEEAYQITTTKGLAAAFDVRAKSLAWSMRGWVLGLAVALASGSFIGASRLSTLAAELAKATPSWPTITTHIVVSLLGIGAPLWFSWLATKQIGQRFRLAEDYAFKASVAKAYEGYRKQAAQIDPEFQTTLFKSALTRLDEAPLRLVESEQHASPWQEALQSAAVKDAMKLAPELQTKFMTMVNETLQQAKSVAAEAAKVVNAARDSTSQGAKE